MTRETETLFYNHRMIVDTMVESEPRVWLISKVNRISPNGICRVTLYQDKYDIHKDFVEHDESGNIIGMWADYYGSNLQPEPVIIDDPDSIVSQITSSITCSGKQQLKIGGSAKTLTVIFRDETGEITDYQSGEWSYTIDDVDVTDLLTITAVADGRIKILFNGDDSYINKILKVTFTSGEISSSLDLEILPL